jgi:hypothetical protein
MNRVMITGAGPQRGLALEVKGRHVQLLDEKGEPALFSKAECHAATYGQNNAAYRAMMALLDPQRLKEVKSC